MTQYHCFFGGRVQGVGFRFVARGVALRHRVSGWVRNLPDGRVELCVQGTEPMIAAFLHDLRGQMVGHIQREDGNYESETPSLSDFEIRY
ncbi:MAG: acylphosphatase [Planctomycetes bacterium]|nr:acylphosphatase [Planctomycetota bacterium]MBI3848274.1 acylphosphatase [Planctomycetota bacterium]